MLHKDRVEEFAKWCEAQDYPVRRDPSGEFQLLGVYHRKVWHYLYSRVRMAEHVTVPEPLYYVVRRFVDETKMCGSRKMGEYNWLHCCRERGHDGEHNYVVSDMKKGKKNA